MAELLNDTSMYGLGESAGWLNQFKRWRSAGPRRQLSPETIEPLSLPAHSGSERADACGSSDLRLGPHLVGHGRAGFTWNQIALRRSRTTSIRHPGRIADVAAPRTQEGYDESRLADLLGRRAETACASPKGHTGLTRRSGQPAHAPSGRGPIHSAVENGQVSRGTDRARHFLRDVPTRSRTPRLPSWDGGHANFGVSTRRRALTFHVKRPFSGFRPLVPFRADVAPHWLRLALPAATHSPVTAASGERRAPE
jgi:hypothetical protein